MSLPTLKMSLPTAYVNNYLENIIIRCLDPKLQYTTHVEGLQLCGLISKFCIYFFNFFKINKLIKTI